MISLAIANGARGYVVDVLVADLEFAANNCALAYLRYTALDAPAEDKGRIAERAGISALRCGQFEKAQAHLIKATGMPTVSWAAWNGLGVLADRDQDWLGADRSYIEALRLAPANAEVLNNFGWSLMLRGEWQRSLEILERAAALQPGLSRLARNLELVRTAVTQNLPERQLGESDESWSARLNDAGVVAYKQGNVAKARAAFARAVEVRGHWFERAANNLELTETAP
jgi:Flp pilus assembly protein TadD